MCELKGRIDPHHKEPKIVISTLSPYLRWEDIRFGSEAEVGQRGQVPECIYLLASNQLDNLVVQVLGNVRGKPMWIYEDEEKERFW